jgi:hypothetical protein
MKMRDLFERDETGGQEVTWAKPRTSAEWTPVWVDVAKLDASWRKDDLYIGPGGEGGIRTRYPDFGKWLAAEHVPVGLPEVSLGWKDHVVFGNGRHRFSWMRDHGAQALPVMVPSEMAQAFRQRFGTPLRQTTLLS